MSSNDLEFEKTASYCNEAKSFKELSVALYCFIQRSKELSDWKAIIEIIQKRANEISQEPEESIDKTELSQLIELVETRQESLFRLSIASQPQAIQELCIDMKILLKIC